MGKGTPKACLDCGKITTNGSRCPSDQAIWDASQERRHHNPVYDTAAWRDLRARILGAWVKRHGYLCPGNAELHHKPHLTRDLTVDHVVPLAEGGALLDEANTRVLCRSANSTLGNARRRAWAARGQKPIHAGGATARGHSGPSRKPSGRRAGSIRITPTNG